MSGIPYTGVEENGRQDIGCFNYVKINLKYLETPFAFFLPYPLINWKRPIIYLSLHIFFRVVLLLYTLRIYEKSQSSFYFP